jgi:hypothetical protein
VGGARIGNLGAVCSLLVGKEQLGWGDFGTETAVMARGGDRKGRRRCRGVRGSFHLYCLRSV